MDHVALNSRLGSDQGLLLTLTFTVLLLAPQVHLRGLGEIRVLQVRLGRLRGSLGGSGSATDHLLGLCGVVAHVLLGDLGSLRSVLAGDLAQLLGLAVDQVGGLLEVVVDELLVGGIDQGNEEQEGGGNQSKAPVRDDLDQVVRQECANSSLRKCFG